jgi:hypothetical protein
VEVGGRPTWHEVHGAGRPDVPGPLTYGVMTDDTVAYLDEVVGRTWWAGATGR